MERNNSIKELGQSTVEYILLLSVIVGIAAAVFKSRYFQMYFGSGNKFAENVRQEIEYSYRHGLSGRKPFEEPNYSSSRHDTFLKGGETRFFSAKDKYPQ
jgi:hypothetical protein